MWSLLTKRLPFTIPFSLPFSVRLHPLFVLLMLLSVVTGFFMEIITLFSIVLIHELGHVAAARNFGWKIREIQLLPFGGVAVVEHAGNVPAKEEVLVAAAGPLQNAAMIVFAWVMLWAGVGDAVWWDYFISANMMIGLFNLLPIMPLDGGKMLLSACGCLFPYLKALSGATVFSMAASCGFIALSIWLALGQPLSIPLNLLLIGLFLLYANWHDYRNIPFRHMRFLIDRQSRTRGKLADGTLAQPIVVGGQRKVSEILRMFMKEKYHLIYVMDDEGAIRAVFPETRVIQAYFHELKPGSAVSELFV
jgi:stage IV sporulation protein FB